MQRTGKPLTLSIFSRSKTRGEKLTVITAYDLTSALIASAGGVDAILVGDSVGMVVLGHENTLSVTLEDILHHTKAVLRARPGVPVIADMPYGSFHISSEDTVRNALRLIKEGGASAVKVEGGKKREPIITALMAAEIPVMGHVGLTPQSINRLGGYKVQGRGEDAAKTLMDDALALEKAGCFSIVLECVPSTVATDISNRLSIPTIGIGAGAGCDGQVLVMHDMLGLFTGLKPRFVKRYAELGEAAVGAVKHYVQEVREENFPGPEHGYAEKPGKKNVKNTGVVSDGSAVDPKIAQGYLSGQED
jgi:3-methyl-2-oxobutanoate hydroxymethyltransferase